MATSSFQLLRTKTLVLPSAPLSFLCPCSIFQQIHWAQSSEHMWNSITSQHLHRCHPGPNHHSLALGDDSCFWLSLFLPSRQFFTQQLVWAFKNISQVSLLSHNSQIAPMSLEKSSNSVTYNALCDLGITSPQPFSLLLSWSFPFALHQSHLSPGYFSNTLFTSHKALFWLLVPSAWGAFPADDPHDSLPQVVLTSLSSLHQRRLLSTIAHRRIWTPPTHFLSPFPALLFFLALSFFNIFYV